VGVYIYLAVIESIEAAEPLLVHVFAMAFLDGAERSRCRIFGAFDAEKHVVRRVRCPVGVVKMSVVAIGTEGGAFRIRCTEILFGVPRDSLGLALWEMSIY
jgi:hypothetical protein